MTKANKIDQEIGQKIEIFRNIKRKSRKFLAEKLGISYQQIKNYEDGINRVSASNLFEISKILNTPIDKFFPEKK